MNWATWAERFADLKYCLKGTLTLPGDKSISHRALMLLGMASGTAMIRQLSSGKDVLSTFRCMQQLGVEIDPTGVNAYRIKGVKRLISPKDPLDCGNSGTTIRLLSGLLCGSQLNAILTGDSSLQKRPMRRVVEPLRQMGASITALTDNDCAPLQIAPPSTGTLHGIDYRLPMASAQIKSAILLAGLTTLPDESIQVGEPLPSRDHTERMLNALGASVKHENNTIQLVGRQENLKAQDIIVPGDISAAAFWLVGAAILPESAICLQQVGLNPGRTGILEILQEIGVPLSFPNSAESAGEPYSDIVVENTGWLTGNITISPEKVPALIDEIPILTVLGLFTKGIFTLRGAEELRYKETDRLAALVKILQQLKIDVEVWPDGFTFEGNPEFQIPKTEEPFETYHDHRLVMALEILSLRTETPLPIAGREWAAVSYPQFFENLQYLLKDCLKSA